MGSWPKNCSHPLALVGRNRTLVGEPPLNPEVVGGAAGKSVRKADLLVTVKTTDEALDAALLFFQYYRENANFLERTYDFVERIGIEKIRKGS